MRSNSLLHVSLFWACVLPACTVSGMGTGVGVFSRPGQLGRAHALDALIVACLNNYTREHPGQHQHLIQGYISEHSVIWGSSGWAGEDTTTMPLRGSLAELTLTRRLGRDWPKLLQEHGDKEKDWDAMVSKVLDKELSLGLVVSETDITWAALALIRLQNVYTLNITQTLSTIDSKRTPSVFRNIMEVGVLALEDEMFGTAVQWFTAISNVLLHDKIRSSSGKLDPVLEETLIQANKLLHIATTAHDQKLSTAGYEGKPGNFPHPLKKVSMQEQLRLSKNASFNDNFEQIPNPPANADPTFSNNKDTYAFRALCRGESTMVDSSTSELHCTYSSLGSPWLILQPAKVEQLHLDPPITAFHNVLSERQIIILKELAQPLQGQAGTQRQVQTRANDAHDNGRDAEILSRTRTSHNAWLPNDLHLTIQGITNRIQELTGLNLDQRQGGAEDLQVNQYSTAGHYVPHIDALSLMKHIDSGMRGPDINNEHPHGDRIATFMLYLNDVSRGGATVFPRLGVKMLPQAGSAIFWYNLHHHGYADSRTLHAACPVLKGGKWVANKWIKHHPQMHLRPCQLSL